MPFRNLARDICHEFDPDVSKETNVLIPIFFSHSGGTVCLFSGQESRQVCEDWPSLKPGLRGVRHFSESSQQVKKSNRFHCSRFVTAFFFFAFFLMPRF